MDQTANVSSVFVGDLAFDTAHGIRGTLATLKAGQNVEDGVAIEAKRLEVAVGKATVESAHAWAKSRFAAETFFDLFPVDPAVHLSEVAWRLPVAIAWVGSAGDPEFAKARYREFRTFGLRQDDWADAELELRSRLLGGQLIATAIEIGNDERTVIPSYKWNDLIFERHGAADVIVIGSRFNTCYLKARVDAAEVKRLWLEQSRAARRTFQKMADVEACTAILVERMRADPHNPIPKAELRGEFSGLSDRGFDTSFANAVRIANAPAWSAPGRRRCNRRRANRARS